MQVTKKKKECRLVKRLLPLFCLVVKSPCKEVLYTKAAKVASHLATEQDSSANDKRLTSESFFKPTIENASSTSPVLSPFCAPYAGVEPGYAKRSQ